VQPASGGPTTFSPSKVIPFKRGEPATSTQDARSRRTTARARGRLSAERPRVRRPQWHWPRIQAASSTALSR
jgi:hypothetical protein